MNREATHALHEAFRASEPITLGIGGRVFSAGIIKFGTAPLGHGPLELGDSSYRHVNYRGSEPGYDVTLTLREFIRYQPSRPAAPSRTLSREVDLSEVVISTGPRKSRKKAELIAELEQADGRIMDFTREVMDLKLEKRGLLAERNLLREERNELRSRVRLLHSQVTAAPAAIPEPPAAELPAEADLWIELEA